MKRAILLILLAFSTISVYSQVELYLTYNDYKNNTPKTYSSKTEIKAGSYNLTINDGKKEKYIYSDFYGFKYKNVLFRTAKDRFYKNYHLTALISSGKINYWENGVYVLESLDHPDKKNFVTPDGTGGGFYFSKTVESEIVYEDLRPFFASNPEYNKIGECVFEKIPEKVKKSPMYKSMKLKDNIDLLNWLTRIWSNSYAGVSFIEYVRECSINANK